MGVFLFFSIATKDQNTTGFERCLDGFRLLQKVCFLADDKFKEIYRQLKNMFGFSCHCMYVY